MLSAYMQCALWVCLFVCFYRGKYITLVKFIFCLLGCLSVSIECFNWGNIDFVPVNPANVNT